VRTVASRQIIIAVSGSARAKSIRPGMMLGEAKALCATVMHAEHEPQRDAVALEALARWMMRFSPVVALCSTGFQPVSKDPRHGLEARATDDYGVFLDMSGSQRLFGSLHRILEAVRVSLARMKISAQLAIAPTPGAAWALSRASKEDCVIISRDDLPRAIEHLPPIALRIDEGIAKTLHHLGLCMIGDVLRLPRETLPARFGDQLLLRIDQALGNVPEPLVPIEPFSPIESRMDFDYPIASIEALWAILQKLIGQIVAELSRRGRGAREVQVEFFRPYAPDGARTLVKTIHLSRPSRNAANLFNLIHCATEMIEIANRDEGFWGIRLSVMSSQRISDEQIQLLENEQFIGEQELTHLIERLCARLGESIVMQSQLVESHVPEQACNVSSTGVPPVSRAGCPCYKKPVRPLHLLRYPKEIRVIVSPSDDRNGRPISFTDDAGVVHRITHAIGPERIAGQWWQGHDKTRDYFEVESSANEQNGKRFWIFRVLQTGRWFMHGVFE
jgi:protein ImuB